MGGILLRGRARPLNAGVSTVVAASTFAGVSTQGLRSEVISQADARGACAA
jgi:hypothetical protein